MRQVAQMVAQALPARAGLAPPLTVPAAPLARTPVLVPGPTRSPAPSVHAVDGLGEGQRLAPAVADRASRVFGFDFSHVRVHVDSASSALANRLGARAFTAGRHIGFAHDAWLPSSPEGQRRLGHELAHVVQQSRGGRPPSPLPGTPLEAEAERAGGAFADGSTSFSVTGAAGVGWAREPRSLTKTLALGQLTLEELQRERDLLVEWLAQQTSSSEETARASSVLADIEGEVRRRTPQAPAATRPTPPALPALQGSAPRFGLPAAADAFQGIQLFALVRSLPWTTGVDTRMVMRRGPYIIAPNINRDEAGQPVSIGYYIAYRIQGGWNEWVVGPGEIDTFLGSLDRYDLEGGISYINGSPPPHVAEGIRAQQAIWKGDIGGAFSSIGAAWREAVKDPWWWFQSATAVAGGLASRATVVGTQARTFTPRVIQGGRQTFSPPRVQGGGPMPRVSTPTVVGNTALKVESALPAVAPIPAVASTPALRLVPQASQAPLMTPALPISPLVPTTAVAIQSLMRPAAVTTPRAGTAPLPAWEPSPGESHPSHAEVEEAARESSTDCGALAYAISVLIKDLRFRRWDMQRQRGGGNKGHRDAYVVRQDALKRLVGVAKTLNCPYDPAADTEITLPHSHPTRWF